MATSPENTSAPDPLEPVSVPATPAAPGELFVGGSQFFLLAITFEAGLAGLALGLGWLLGFDPASTWQWSIADSGWALLATAPLLGILWVIDCHPFGRLVRLRQLVHAHVVPLFRGMKVWHLAAIAAAAGIGEELLFRGLIQGGLGVLLTRLLVPLVAVSAALILTSLLFALVHMISPEYAVLCFAMGLYLGGVWLATGNLLVAAIVHGLYDFLALVFLVRKK